MVTFREGHGPGEKPRRLFRPVRGVDLKIAWQIHAKEMRRGGYGRA